MSGKEFRVMFMVRVMVRITFRRAAGLEFTVIG